MQRRLTATQICADKNAAAITVKKKKNDRPIASGAGVLVKTYAKMIYISIYSKMDWDINRYKYTWREWECEEYSLE